MIALNECQIARRGKAAKGSVPVKVIGIPSVGDDGIARDFDYDHVSEFSTSDLLDFIRQAGLPLNKVIAMGADKLLRSAAISSQSPKVEIQKTLIAKGLATLKNAESKAQAVINTANLTDMTIDEVIAAMMAKQAKLAEENAD